MTRVRRFWGWGFEDEGPDPARLAMAEAGLAASFSQPLTRMNPPRLDEIARHVAGLVTRQERRQVVGRASVHRSGSPNHANRFEAMCTVLVNCFTERINTNFVIIVNRNTA